MQGQEWLIRRLFRPISHLPADKLGIPSSPKKGGASSGIVFILIKNSGSKKPLTCEEIEDLGNSKLTEEDITALLE